MPPSVIQGGDRCRSSQTRFQGPLIERVSTLTAFGSPLVDISSSATPGFLLRCLSATENLRQNIRHRSEAWLRKNQLGQGPEPAMKHDRGWLPQDLPARSRDPASVKPSLCEISNATPFTSVPSLATLPELNRVAGAEMLMAPTTSFL